MIPTKDPNVTLYDDKGKEGPYEGDCDTRGTRGVPGERKQWT